MPAKTAARATPVLPNPEAQLRAFIDKFDPANQKMIRAVRKVMRSWFPTANELVYDNYNFFVIGYTPNERPSDAIISVVASANGVGICFIRGATLPDPHKLLNGEGKQTRFIHVDSPAMLQKPEVKALFAAAIAQSKVSLRASGKAQLVIRSVSAKQRPRRKTTPGK
jgi:hypothetical protein